MTRRVVQRGEIVPDETAAATRVRSVELLGCTVRVPVRGSVAALVDVRVRVLAAVGEAPAAEAASAFRTREREAAGEIEKDFPAARALHVYQLLDWTSGESA